MGRLTESELKRLLDQHTPIAGNCPPRLSQRYDLPRVLTSSPQRRALT